jgi:HSP20 family molecular chaperone IbpA
MSQKNPKKPFTPFDSWLDEYQKVAAMKDIPKEAFPPIDIKVNEETEETIVELKVEGFKKEELKVKVKRNKIIIKGKAKEKFPESCACILKQSASKTFKRVLTINEKVEEVSAKLDGDILRLVIFPKFSKLKALLLQLEKQQNSSYK